MNIKELDKLVDYLYSNQSQELVWFPESGFGYYPIRKIVEYDADYFEKYEAYKDTEMGRQITQFRLDFVNSVHDGHVLDVGVGSGDFIEKRGRHTYGYDVSPYCIDYLKKKRLYFDPFDKLSHVSAITCWDSLEHIQKFWQLIDVVQGWVFITVPIVRTAEQTISSVHYKPDEHYWYFTEQGLIDIFRMMGFQLVKSSAKEVFIGRRDVMSFAFRRAK